MIFATLLGLASIVACFFRRDNALVYAAFFYLAFGSFSIVPAAGGGTTVLASSFAFLLIVVKVAMQPGGLARAVAAAGNLRAMGFLFLFMGLAVVWALVVPRLSGSNILVYPMNVGPTSFPVHLQPTGANFNQAAYQVISCAVAIAFYIMARNSDFGPVFLRAVLWGAAAVVITGVADMIPPLDPVLKLFRTAAYTFLDSAEVLGVSRVTGLMPEASSFGTLAAALGSLLLFCRYAYEPRQRRWALSLGAMCLAFAALSTSSTAFLLLAAIFGLLGVDLASRLLVERAADKRAAMREIVVIAAVLLVFVLAAFVFERQRDFVMQMLDASLFKKSQSSSYIERSAWSHQALKAFIDSNGIGVGVGSVRTSNFFINILASTGILGTGLFALFLLRVFMARVPVSAPQDFEIVRGSKMALIVIFFGLFFIGTVPDYGVLAAALFGIIVGTSMAYRAHFASSHYPLPESVARPFAQSLP